MATFSDQGSQGSQGSQGNVLREFEKIHIIDSSEGSQKNSANTSMPSYSRDLVLSEIADQHSLSIRSSPPPSSLFDGHNLTNLTQTSKSTSRFSAGHNLEPFKAPLPNSQTGPDSGSFMLSQYHRQPESDDNNENDYDRHAQEVLQSITSEFEAQKRYIRDLESQVASLKESNNQHEKDAKSMQSTLNAMIQQVNDSSNLQGKLNQEGIQLRKEIAQRNEHLEQMKKLYNTCNEELQTLRVAHRDIKVTFAQRTNEWNKRVEEHNCAQLVDLLVNDNVNDPSSLGLQVETAHEMSDQQH